MVNGRGCAAQWRMGSCRRGSGHGTRMPRSNPAICTRGGAFAREDAGDHNARAQCVGADKRQPGARGGMGPLTLCEGGGVAATRVHASSFGDEGARPGLCVR